MRRIYLSVAAALVAVAAAALAGQPPAGEGPYHVQKTPKWEARADLTMSTHTRTGESSTSRGPVPRRAWPCSTSIP